MNVVPFLNQVPESLLLTRGRFVLTIVTWVRCYKDVMYKGNFEHLRLVMLGIMRKIGLTVSPLPNCGALPSSSVIRARL
jgi:hypothetical protein